MTMQEDSRQGKMRDRVLSKPQLIRERWPGLVAQAEEVISLHNAQALRHVLAGGSGDSHCAAVATEMAFEAVAGLPMQALHGMALGRYTIPWLPPSEVAHTLVIAISVSGEVSRTIEAFKLARDLGCPALALTANPESRLGRESELFLDITVSQRDVPGVHTYLGTLLGLYGVAFRLAELRGAISGDEGERWRSAILRVADIMEITNEAISDKVRETARAVRERQNFVFLGSGPNYGTALFGAEKIVEAVGCHELAQDLEEWAHLQRFNKEEGTPYFVIAPPGASYPRAVEVAKMLKHLGQYLIAIVKQGEQAISAIADVVLPVCGQVPEPLTALVYCNALELFASDLAQEVDEPYMRNFVGRWDEGGAPSIRASEIVDRVKHLRRDNAAQPG